MPVNIGTADHVGQSHRLSGLGRGRVAHSLASLPRLQANPRLTWAPRCPLPPHHLRQVSGPPNVGSQLQKEQRREGPGSCEALPSPLHAAQPPDAQAAWKSVWKFRALGSAPGSKAAPAPPLALSPAALLRTSGSRRGRLGFWNVPPHSLLLSFLLAFKKALCCRGSRPAHRSDWRPGEGGHGRSTLYPTPTPGALPPWLLGEGVAAPPPRRRC